LALQAKQPHLGALVALYLWKPVHFFFTVIYFSPFVDSILEIIVLPTKWMDANTKHGHIAGVPDE
jgi:hypothetical protein